MRKTASASYIQIYVLEEQTGTLQEYNSITDLKKKRFLNIQGGLMKGCVERNGALGNIQLNPFVLSIKGLDTDFDYS